jgi:zinc protease
LSNRISQNAGFAPVRNAYMDNGLNVFVCERPAVPVVSIQIWVRTGSIHEQEYLGCGLSHFLEHMLFQGCDGYPGQSAADAVNRLGGEFNAYTSFGCTVYYIDLPSRHLAEAVKILSAMISTPEFPEEKFLSEKDVILRERDMVRDNPGRLLGEKLWQNVFSTHPVRHPIIGYHDLIKSVDRDMMVDYYNRRYSPLRSFFVVSGDVQADEVFKEVEKNLGTWRLGRADEPSLPHDPPQAAPHFSEFTFPDPLARLAIGYRTPAATHRDTPALDILSGILGMNRSSRLVSRLRIRESLALQVGAMNYAPYFCGMFGVTAAAMPENMAKLEDGIFEEIARICDSGVTTEEVARERLQQSTEYLRLLNTASGIARVTGESVLSCGSPEYPEVYFKLLESVTPEIVRNAAEKYLQPETVTVVRMKPETTDSTMPKTSAPAENGKPTMVEKNGARLVMLPDKQLPLIDLCAILPGGTILETPENAGITRLVATLLGTGCSGKTEEEINQELDDNAIELHVTGGANTLLVRMNCRRERFTQAAGLFCKLLASPAFEEKEFERERGNTIEALKSRVLSPQSAAEDLMIKELFGTHPYSLPRAGVEKSIQNITRQNIEDFYRQKCLIREAAVFGISGDFEEKEAMKFFSKIRKSIPWSTEQPAEQPPLPEFPKSPVEVETTVPREQAVVMLGLPGCDNCSEDRFALDILQEAVNGQAAALFKAVREDAGLAYYTGMYSMRGIQPGFMTFYAGTGPDTITQVIPLFKAEKQRLTEKGLEEEEFAAAREAVIFNLTQEVQQPGRRLAAGCLSEFYGNGYDSLGHRLEVFNSITREEVNAIISRHMSTENTVTAIAKPEASN